MARVRARYNDRRLRRNVDNIERVYDGMIKRVIEYHATAGEADMKANAPWVNRTGAARAGLYTFVTHEAGHYTIIFGHSVHYGIWLEVKFNGRDAIIMPTVLNTGKALMRDLKRIAP